MESQADILLGHARTHAVVRPRDLADLGVPRAVLSRLVQRGLMERVGRGLYRHVNGPVGPHQSLVEVASALPHGVINLVSALSFHDLTDELPAAVWVAVERGTQTPLRRTVPLELTRTQRRFLTLGVASHTIDGIEVRVTEPARTVADCFKYRSRVGLDVSLAALREYLTRHRAGRDELWRMAAACRVGTVIRPYLESMS